MDIQDETNRIAIVDDERTRALRLERAAIRDAGSRERRRARQEQARRSAEIEDVLDHRFRPGRFQEKEVEESGGITLHKHASFEKFTFGPRSATFHEWGDDGGIETFVARVGVGSKLGVNSRALVEGALFGKAEMTYIAGYQPVSPLGVSLGTFGFSLSSVGEVIESASIGLGRRPASAELSVSGEAVGMQGRVDFESAPLNRPGFLGGSEP